VKKTKDFARRKKGVPSPQKAKKKSVEYTVSTGFSDTKAPWMAGLNAAKLSLERLGGGRPKFALIFSTIQYDIRKVVDGASYILKDTPLVGASTYGMVFNEENISDYGVVVSLFRLPDVEFSIHLESELKGGLSHVVDNIISPLIKTDPSSRKKELSHKALFILLDTFINCEFFLDEVRQKIRIPVMGGILEDKNGKGEVQLVTMKKKVDKGIIAMGILSKNPLGIAHTHGFFPLAPRRVTRASGNVIYELDGKPALSVFKDFFLRRGYKMENGEEDFTKLLSRFHIGIPHPFVSGFSKVRLPLGITPDGGILLAGDVPDKSTIWIMEARQDKMLDSVSDIINEIERKLEGRKPAGVLILEGLPRLHCLEGNAVKELELVRERVKCPIFGMTTFGELIEIPGEPSGFHNSSVIITAFPE